MDVLTISQLTRSIKHQLNQRFPSVWVNGEVSGLTQPSSGHLYFTLKDQHAQINAIIWASDAQQLGFELTNGLKIICRGGVDVYPPRGSYQLIVRRVQPQGVGALELAFRQLHQKLKSEGLFDPAHKRPLPGLPRHLAVVTSPSGAAIRDFLQVIHRRWPNIRITIVPVRVQGAGAAEEIAAGIDSCQRWKTPPDVIVVTRGGGSIEDLWSFNEEIVVRSIFASSIPIVSGVGHEIDVTLSDLVADVRALTPSEAAERVVPDLSVVLESLNVAGARLKQALITGLQRRRDELDQIGSRPAFRRPHDRLQQLAMELDYLEQQLNRSTDIAIKGRQDQLASLAQRLETINPLSVLSRGYSLTTTENQRLLSSIEQVQPGDQINVRLRDGIVHGRVESIESS